MMEMNSTVGLSTIIAGISNPLNNDNSLDPLMNYIGDAKYVLLGEASHGTHEYYTYCGHCRQTVR
jgi:erythromycin esterase